MGVVSTSNLLDFAFSGPMLRSSGFGFDLRKNQPYEHYDELNFSVPIGFLGDSYDRFLIRIEEMRQSIQLIQEGIELLTFQKSNLLSTVNDHTSYMEAVITHYKKYSLGLLVKKNKYLGLSTALIEAPKGLFGVSLLLDGSVQPYRCKINSPGFKHLQGLDFMSKNLFLADVVTLIGTQDIVFGEVDR